MDPYKTSQYFVDLPMIPIIHIVFTDHEKKMDQKLVCECSHALKYFCISSLYMNLKNGMNF